MPGLAGHHARLGYLWENDSSGNPNFATDSPDDSTLKTFGADVTMNTLEGSNNAVRVFDPGSRKAANIIEQNFDGSWSVEFTLTNPWFLKAVIDNSFSTSGSSAPYSHNLSGDLPYSMRLVQYTEGSDNERILLGCVVSSMSISADVGGLVNVSLEGAYADEETVEGPDSPEPQPETDQDLIHFGHATVSRGGDTLSLVQQASLTINNNTDILGELGTRFGVDYSPKQFTVDVDYTDIAEDNDSVKRMYGGSTETTPQEAVTNQADIVFSFDNGLTGSEANSLLFTLDNAFAESASRSGIGDPESDLEDQLNEMIPDVTVTAENSTEAPL